MRPTHARFPARILFATIIALAASAAAQAQHAPDGASSHAWPRCGTYRMQRFDHATAVRNTAVAAPELYRQAVAESKGTAMRMMSGDEASFWVPDYVTMQYVRVNAVRVHTGRLARVWVDVRDTARAAVKERVPVLIKALEDSTAPASRNPGKGIIENDIEVFGPAPTAVGDGFQDFLLFDISDQSILGFFMPGDQTTEQFSNRRNLLYIDSREGIMQLSSLLNTLAHEFQHLLHHGANPDPDLFINEGCSEVAGLMCGYTDRQNQNYLRNTNTMLLDFPREGDDNLEAYERALTVMHYLYEQFGDSFLRAIPHIRSYGMAVINEALKASHPSDPRAHWDSVGRAFAVSNWMQTSTDPRYGYRVSLTHVTQRRAKHLRTYTPTTIRANDSVTLQPYGAAYIVYETPPTLFLGVQGRYRYGVTAIAYTGADAEVLTFAQGAPIVIGQPGAIVGYDRVVLILTEQSNASQKITWKVSDGLSSTGDDAAADLHGDLSIVPNPASSHSSVTFGVRGDGLVDLVLYAPSGQAALRVIDAQRMSAGTHRVELDVDGLPSGAYLARLSEGATVTTRIVVVR